MRKKRKISRKTRNLTLACFFLTNPQTELHPIRIKKNNFIPVLNKIYH